MEKDGQKVWSGILSRLKNQISTSNYKTWFSGAVVLNYKKLNAKNLLVVGLRNNFLKEQIENRYLSIISEIKNSNGFDNLDVVFVVSQPKTNGSNLKGPLFTGEPLHVSLRSAKFEALNPSYKFETFVAGQSNNLAYAAATQVCQSLGHVYNPVLFFGPTGVGKTHLLQAIGNSIMEKYTDSKVLYVTSEKFTNDFIESLRNNTQQNFRQKFRNVDLLLIDDIQFFAGKESTQDEFFHCINELTMTSRQVVVVSDRHPKDLGKLKERLVSRFLGGMIADIGYPDFELKSAILKIKCRQRNVSLDDEIIAYIAQESDGGARELEGVLVTTLAQIKICGNKFNLEAIKALIVENKQKVRTKINTVDIRKSVCEYYKIDWDDLVGQSRKAKLVKARQIFMYLLRRELKLPLVAIGEQVGKRDHSTVIHGIEKVENVLRDNSFLRDDILRISQVLTEKSRLSTI